MTVITNMYGDAIRVTQLYYARAAADLGSFSKAAASLGVTQPALSNGIGVLERTLGGTLFDRSTTGVTLTPLAVKVLPHLNVVLAGLDSLLVEARGATGKQADPLRMGVSPLIHPALVARAFQAARQQEPSALILKEDNLADLRTALFARHLDLILVPAVTDAAGCERRRIDTEPIHYLPPAHVSASTPMGRDGEPIELAELSGHPLLMVGDACGLTTFTRSLFTSAASDLVAYPGEADTYGSLEDWAGLGLGGALMPASRFRDYGATRPLHHREEPVTINYEALWLAHSTRGQAVAALIDTVLDHGA